MKSLRTWVSAVLGLALLVQGVAVASAPQAAAAKASATASVADASQMPCHGDAAKPAQAPPCACCDGGCIDMGGCSMGHVVAVVPSARISTAPVHQGVIAAVDRRVESISLPSPLRPPIAFHV
jgi:hypothetical protein